MDDIMQNNRQGESKKVYTVGKSYPPVSESNGYQLEILSAREPTRGVAEHFDDASVGVRM